MSTKKYKISKALDGISYDALASSKPEKIAPKLKTEKKMPIFTEHEKFNYMMLSRLKEDNDYFLGAGDKQEKHLWAGNVDAQIAEMKRVWNMIPEGKKPEWLSLDDIFEYEKKMKPTLNNEGGQECYIEYLNKDKGFKKDVINFSSYEQAVKWAKENFEKFDPDMINYKMAKGGNIYLNKEDGWIYTVGKNTNGLWTVFGELPGVVEKRDEYPEKALASEEDAILIAKGMAGLTPEFAKGGKIKKVENSIEILKNKVGDLSALESYDGVKGNRGLVVYIQSEEKTDISNYENLKPYAAKSSPDSVRVSFSGDGRRHISFSSNATERNEDRESYDKNGGLIYINEPMTNAIAAEILSKLKIFKSYANGGIINPLEKELRHLQRDLNSDKLRNYTEGDTSEAQLALNKEREVKLARFNELLELLRANDGKKFNNGGEVSFKKAVAFPEALDYLYYVIEEFPETYVAVNIEHVDAWKTHDAATRYHYYEEVLLKSEMVVVEDYEDKEFKNGGEIDKVTMDVPFLIRAMEYSKEEAPDDIDLHKKAEKIIKASQGNRTLEMEDYNTIFADGGEIEPNPVPMEIYKQIGRKAFFMLGAKNIVSHSKENALSFRIRGSNKVNYIKVTLNSMDTYDVEYGKIRGDKYHVVAEDKGIYDDMLLKSIQNNTGLYTKLFGKGGDLKPAHKEFDMVYKVTSDGNKIGKIMEVIDGGDEIKYKVLYHHPFQEITDEKENDIYPYEG